MSFLDTGWAVGLLVIVFLILILMEDIYNGED